MENDYYETNNVITYSEKKICSTYSSEAFKVVKIIQISIRTDELRTRSIQSNECVVRVHFVTELK